MIFRPILNFNGTSTPVDLNQVCTAVGFEAPGAFAAGVASVPTVNQPNCLSAGFGYSQQDLGEQYDLGYSNGYNDGQANCSGATVTPIFDQSVYDCLYEAMRTGGITGIIETGYGNTPGVFDTSESYQGVSIVLSPHTNIQGRPLRGAALEFVLLTDVNFEYNEIWCLEAEFKHASASSAAIDFAALLPGVTADFLSEIATTWQGTSQDINNNILAVSTIIDENGYKQTEYNRPTRFFFNLRDAPSSFNYQSAGEHFSVLIGCRNATNNVDVKLMDMKFYKVL